MGEMNSIFAKRSEANKNNSDLQMRRINRSGSKASSVDRILYLQRTIGNQAVSRLMKSGALQAKLRIGQPGDVYEQEADRVADEVMRMPEPEMQRQVDEEEEEEILQTKPLVDQITPLVQRQVEVTNDLESQINAIKGGGRPLAESERAYFEPWFGADFSRVRVHTGAQAAESAQGVNAKAYTVGQDVVFGAGEYAPATTAGKRLLAHELTHVVQQGCDAGERIQRRERKQSGTAGGGSPSDPCGGSSRAATYTPTDQGVTVNLGPHGFGKTEKYAAQCSFGACRDGGNWRFYIDTLTVRIASAVQPIGFRTNVNAATDAVVTSSTYRNIMGDLRPNRSARMTTTCGGNTFTDNISTYSLRNTYWKRQLVVDHEAYHRQDWDRIYRPELVSAEQQVWGHSIPTSAASTSPNAIQQANSALRSHIGSAYQRACQAYTPQQETRAYNAGAPQYQQLVSDIEARATREGG